MTTKNGFELTNVAGYENVILTAGGHIDGKGQIFGIFAAESDANSMCADTVALGSVGRDGLTDEQFAIAERNTNRLD